MNSPPVSMLGVGLLRTSSPLIPGKQSPEPIQRREFDLTDARPAHADEREPGRTRGRGRRGVRAGGTGPRRWTGGAGRASATLHEHPPADRCTVRVPCRHARAGAAGPGGGLEAAGRVDRPDDHRRRDRLGPRTPGIPCAVDESVPGRPGLRNVPSNRILMLSVQFFPCRAVTPSCPANGSISPPSASKRPKHLRRTMRSTDRCAVACWLWRRTKTARGGCACPCCAGGWSNGANR
jgi:hypothetical protein